MTGLGQVVFREVSHGSPEYWQSVRLREEILRKPLGFVFSEAELCAESDSHHVVGLDNERVVGCVVLKPLSGLRIRMRQLCVAQERRRQGIGTALVIFAEDLARRLGFSEMVLHARKNAVEFYRKLGYQPQGDLFVEIGIPHIRMAKLLTEEQRTKTS